MGTKGRGFYNLKVISGLFSYNSVDSEESFTGDGPVTSCIEVSGVTQGWASVFIG